MYRLVPSLVAVVVFVGCGQRAPAAKTSPPASGTALPPTHVTIEFRRAENEPADGLTAATIPATEQKLYLHDQVELANSDISATRVASDSGGHPAIDVTFNAQGRDKLKELSEQLIDKPLAIVIDGTVVCAPIVRTPIESGHIVITGAFDEGDAQRIADGIVAR